ncbi:uncharacterized protein EV420DRAFT_1486593 [Desarmillaria tabescens]|uniref:Transmembrane protein n=1 Tax=Armillaria tabescens TaxID=1929756 RepID=A0AA39MMC4_ARMTA|nr:uncharacterized protein EV420DRAFT_1486593 [Desarmillaria tabescens]KAK0438710.1 hypothetical protein EV420DRAFT_1486593 [Desarmillaria tabescens]
MTSSGTGNRSKGGHIQPNTTYYQKSGDIRRWVEIMRKKHTYVNQLAVIVTLASYCLLLSLCPRFTFHVKQYLSICVVSAIIGQQKHAAFITGNGPNVWAHIWRVWRDMKQVAHETLLTCYIPNVPPLDLPPSLHDSNTTLVPAPCTRWLPALASMLQFEAFNLCSIECRQITHASGGWNTAAAMWGQVTFDWDSRVKKPGPSPGSRMYLLISERGCSRFYQEGQAACSVSLATEEVADALTLGEEQHHQHQSMPVHVPPSSIIQGSNPSIYLPKPNSATHLPPVCSFANADRAKVATRTSVDDAQQVKGDTSRWDT